MLGVSVSSNGPGKDAMTTTRDVAAAGHVSITATCSVTSTFTAATTPRSRPNGGRAANALRAASVLAQGPVDWRVPDLGSFGVGLSTSFAPIEARKIVTRRWRAKSSRMSISKIGTDGRKLQPVASRQLMNSCQEFHQVSRVGFEPAGGAPKACRRVPEISLDVTRLSEAEESGGEGGIRTLSGPLESASYRFHSARVAVNASDAVAPCTWLHHTDERRAASSSIPISVDQLCRA